MISRNSQNKRVSIMRNMRVVNKQNGAALVIGLLVLLVMTMLGVSSMSTTTTQLKIANNVQTYHTGFQAAEAILQFVLTEGVGGPVPAIDWASDVTQNVGGFVDADLGFTQSSAQVIYADCRNVPHGFSLTQSQSFKGVIHEVRAVGSATNANAKVISRSSQLLGVQTVRPGCPAVE